jgi:hypothetical protein
MLTRSARRRRRHRRRRRTLILAAFLVLAGAVFAEIHAHTQPRDGGTTIPARAVTPASSTPQAGDSGSLAAAGQGLSWAGFHGIELPVSAHDGPRDTRGGLAWGFADTPRGALLTADTSEYAALRAAANVPAGQPAGRGYAVEAAYRFTAWSPAGAAVDILSEGPGSGGATVLAATRIEVLWQRGDWRVIAPPGGDWASSATSISSLTGYTAFPGEG